MNIKNRLTKLETASGYDELCRCREKGHEKKSIEAETLDELMREISEGHCAVCALPHIPPGYTFGKAWIESATEIKSIGLASINAELAASESFAKVLHIKSCTNCGEPFANLTDTCKMGLTMPECCNFLDEKLLEENHLS
jgi:hypothetical protein